MMQKIVVLALALCLVLGAVPAMAEEEPSAFQQFVDDASSSVQNLVKGSGVLEVQGQAVRTVVPDTVSITIGARIQDESEKVAQQQANTIINDVIEALRAIGLSDQQIKTGGYDISRLYDYSDGNAVPQGYEARISLRVTVQNFDLINEILDTAVEKGANDVGSISFSYSDEGTVYKQALQDAILAASGKAEAMALAAGVSLHTLLELREAGGNNPYPYANAYKAMSDTATGGASQVMAGELEITANVTLVYQIK